MEPGLKMAEQKAELYSSMWSKYEWAIVQSGEEFFVVAEKGLGLFETAELVSCWKSGARTA